MHISQKCQYTLRALFELAKHYGGEPVSAAEIAEAQAIPPRFLELILQSLKNSREVDSRRGNYGGYVLAVSPETITVGDVIRSWTGRWRRLTAYLAKRCARSMVDVHFWKSGAGLAMPWRKFTIQRRYEI